MRPFTPGNVLYSAGRSGFGGWNFEDRKTGRSGGLCQAAIGGNEVPAGWSFLAPDEGRSELQGVRSSAGPHL